MSEETAADGRRRREWPTDAATSGELVERLNTGWRVAGPEPASFKQRLAYPARRMLARLFGPQETFNSTVVQYINATNSTQQAMLDITLDQCESALDEVRRHREALAARERRVEAAMLVIGRQHEELQTSIGVLQQATHNVSRELERLQRNESPSRVTSAAEADLPLDATGQTAIAPAADALSHRYVGFEDQFRGSPEAIRAGLADYLSIFAGCADVLDIGCGRGEFLSLLREQGITARGIDLNEAMVDVCREQGLDAMRADALTYLRQLPEESLGGLFAAQVVEHLEPGYLTQLLDTAFGKLRPGAPIVLETINPACWVAFFESFIRDLTHVKPIHPDTLQYLLQASGFANVEIVYRAPIAPEGRLQRVSPRPQHYGDTAPDALTELVSSFNANVDRLNDRIFSYQDFAAIATRP